MTGMSDLSDHFHSSLCMWLISDSQIALQSQDAIKQQALKTGWEQIQQFLALYRKHSHSRTTLHLPTPTMSGSCQYVRMPRYLKDLTCLIIWRYWWVVASDLWSNTIYSAFCVWREKKKNAHSNQVRQDPAHCDLSGTTSFSTSWIILEQ